MGKKYIVNLMDETQIIVEVGANSTGAALIASNPISALTPYTEPDLEQVRKEAYDEGYDDAKGGYENGFENGMIVAWEAAKKLWDLKGEMIKAFRKYSVFDILNCYTASEVIEKLKAYEQEQDAEIKVGDEVINRDKKAVVTEITDRFVRIMYSDGGGYALFSEDMTKTGRHFPEIAAVLEKMRGEQDG